MDKVQSKAYLEIVGLTATVVGKVCVAVFAIKLSTVMLLIGADTEKMRLPLQRMNARFGVGKLIPAPCARRTDALRWSVHGCL